MIKRRFVKIATVALMVAMTMSLTACTGCSGCKNNNTADVETEAEREMSTSTDIFAVDIVDKDGNAHKLEGVGVTGEDGKTTITVTDKDGNTTVIKGESATDSEGNKTVTNATVEKGGNLTASDGTSIDTNGATVGGVKDNNDGSTATDVVVSLDKLVDVLEKQEQASKEAASREQASKEAAEKESREQASKDAEKATEKETEASKENETQAPTSTPTQSATQAPTSVPTTTPTKPAETQAPTTAPTQAPTTSNYGTTDWGATIVSVTESRNSMSYTTSDGWLIGVSKRADSLGRVSVFYEGTAKKPTIPTTFNGVAITRLSIEGNRYIETLVVPDCVDYVLINSCEKLKSITLGKGITTLRSCLINYCYALKELNVKGTIEYSGIKGNFVDGGSLGESYFTADVINFYQNPDTLEAFRGMTTDAERLEKINQLTHGANDFKKINFYY